MDEVRPPKLTDEEHSELFMGLDKLIRAAHSLIDALIDQGPDGLSPNVHTAMINVLAADLSIGALAQKVRDRDREGFDAFERQEREKNG